VIDIERADRTGLTIPPSMLYLSAYLFHAGEVGVAIVSYPLDSASSVVCRPHTHLAHCAGRVLVERKMRLTVVVWLKLAFIRITKIHD
jgi:hypothetical protein